MKNKLLSNLITPFRNLLFIAAGMAICGALCFAFVWPVWFSAVNYPSYFSTAVIIVSVAAILLAVIRRVAGNIKKCPDIRSRKAYIAGFLMMIVRIAVSVLLLVEAVKSVSDGARTTGIILLISAVIFFIAAGSLTHILTSRIKA